MNNWQSEFLAECDRQRILQEMEQIRLEKLALKAGTRRPRFIEKTMINFGNWMISTGKRIRKRYETPIVNCNNPSVDSS